MWHTSSCGTRDSDIIHNFPPIHGKNDSLRHDAGIIVENGGYHENQHQKLVYERGSFVLGSSVSNLTSYHVHHPWSLQPIYGNLTPKTPEVNLEPVFDWESIGDN